MLRAEVRYIAFVVVAELSINEEQHEDEHEKDWNFPYAWTVHHFLISDFQIRVTLYPKPGVMRRVI